MYTKADANRWAWVDRVGALSGAVYVVLILVGNFTTARLLNDMGTAGFVVSFLPFGIFLLAAGLAVLDSGVAGRVTGGSAVVLGSLGILATVVSQADATGTTPLPFLLGLVWILVVGIRFALHSPASSREQVVATTRAAHV